MVCAGNCKRAHNDGPPGLTKGGGKIMKKGVAAALIVMFCTGTAFCEEKRPLVISGLSDYAPVMWTQDGRLQGVAAELAGKIFEELNVPYKFKVLPWKRVQAYARSGKIDVIAGVYQTDERRAYMVYSVPFMQDPGVLFVKKGKTFPYKKWEDLIGRHGITNRGYSWGEQFDHFIATRLDMNWVDSPDQAFEMLTTTDRDTDYYLYGLIPGLLVVNRLNLADRIDYLPDYVTQENFYFAFSKKSGYKGLLPKVNVIIKRLVDEKYVDFLVSRFINQSRTIRPDKASK